MQLFVFYSQEYNVFIHELAFVFLNPDLQFANDTLKFSS